MKKSTFSTPFRRIGLGTLLAAISLGAVNSAHAERSTTSRTLWATNTLEETITGKVTDSRGDALPGVSVLIKGSTRG